MVYSRINLIEPFFGYCSRENTAPLKRAVSRPSTPVTPNFTVLEKPQSRQKSRQEEAFSKSPSLLNVHFSGLERTEAPGANMDSQKDALSGIVKPQPLVMELPNPLV